MLKILLLLLPIVNGLNPGISVKYMNNLRKIHQAPPLIYDTEISKFSTEWAKTLLNNAKFEHSTNKNYGENIAIVYSKKDYPAFVKATDLFYNEYKLYNYSDPKFSYETGHFTQLVWISSKRVGIGMVSNNTFKVLVVNFYPFGNVAGEFSKNVLEPIT